MQVSQVKELTAKESVAVGRRFTAPDMNRALRLLNSSLGPDAVLLSSKKTAAGVEVFALPAMAKRSRSRKAVTLPEPVQYGLLKRLSRLGLPLLEAQRLACEVALDADDIEQAWQLCRERLARQLPLAEEDVVSNGGCFAFVGPSGVGKTASLLKLAARWLLTGRASDVAIIQLASSSVAVGSCLERFSALTSVPLFRVDSQHSLADRMAQCGRFSLLLIDTAALVNEDDGAVLWRSLGGGTLPIHPLLVLPTTGETRWLSRIIDRYRMTDCIGCVLTQQDQSPVSGALLSLLGRQCLPVRYLSRGSLLPKHIVAADRELLLSDIQQDASGDRLMTGGSL